MAFSAHFTTLSHFSGSQQKLACKLTVNEKYLELHGQSFIQNILYSGNLRRKKLLLLKKTTYILQAKQDYKCHSVSF